MRKAIPIAVVAVLLAASGALAQSKSGTSATPPAGSDARGVAQAPVGHRQPRANDVPTAQEKGYNESAEDKALDRRIKSICRGC